MAPASLDGAPPPPSILRAPMLSDKFSQRQSTRSSRASSGDRRPSPPKLNLMEMTPDEILTNHTTPDVMSDLLASFPTINASPPWGPASPVQIPSLRPSVRPSRQASKDLDPPPSLFGTRSSRNVDNRLPFELHKRDDDVSERSSEDEAAMPPVVRTSRPPSGLTTPRSQSTIRSQSTLRSGRSRFAPSPKQVFSPPPERFRPPGAARGDTNGLQNGYQSPSQTSVLRDDSFDTTRSRESSTKRFWKLYPRSKDRAMYSSSNASFRSTYQRAEIVSSSVQSPVQRSIIGSARLSEDEGEYYRTINTINGKMQVISGSGITTSKETPPSTSHDDSEPPLLEYRRDTGLPSPSASDNFPAAPSETLSEVVKAKPPASIPKEDYRSRKVFIAPDDDEDETDVTRRIKELKAARENRRKSFKDRSPDDRPSTSQVLKSPLQGSPPSTARAAEQLAEARMIDERTFSGGDQDEGDPYSLDVPVPPPEASNVFVQRKLPITSMPKERAFIVESRDSTTRSSARPSFDTQTQSLSASKRQGRSPGLSPQIPPLPGSPKGEHKRNRFSFSRASPMIDEQRPSLDPIGASVQDCLASPRLSQQVFFPSDGRRISFSEVGDPNGYVVFCCVGMGLTRYIMAYYDELATSLKLRLITPDRPGIGDSEPYADPGETPYEWPDDVQVICAKLGITRFSVLAHSAGVIYALATALRMSQFLRGKMHLLAPWIPPSQLTNPNATDVVSNTPSGTLPRSQRLLRMLPTSFLKLSNSSLTGLSRNNSPKPSPAKGRKANDSASKAPTRPGTSQGQPMPPPRLAPKAVTRPPSPHLEDILQIPSGHDFAASGLPKGASGTASVEIQRRLYDRALTPAIWEKATRNANPAVDLLVCLERTRPIGFRYADVGSKPARDVRDRAAPVDDVGCQWPGYGIVIHHGSKDTRVPVENARWLGRVMTKAEVRVLEGEGHGLMAAAGVMGSVLNEIGKEWASANW